MVAPNVVAQGVLARVGLPAHVTDVLADVLVHRALMAAAEPVHREGGAADSTPERRLPALCGQRGGDGSEVSAPARPTRGGGANT